MLLSKTSRLRFTQQIIVDGEETFGKWAQPYWLRTKPDESLIRTFAVTSDLEGRPDLISNIVYNTPHLDWAIIAFNAIHYNDVKARDCLNWPPTGLLVKYPIESLIIPSLS